MCGYVPVRLIVPLLSAVYIHVCTRPCVCIPSFVRTSVAWPVCAARPRTKGWERKELGQCDFANSFPRCDRNLTSTTACSVSLVVFYEPSLAHFELFCSTRRLRENKPFNRFNLNDFEQQTNCWDLSRLITNVLAFCLFPVEYLIPAKMSVLLVWSLSLGGNILPLVWATLGKWIDVHAGRTWIPTGLDIVFPRGQSVSCLREIILNGLD